MTRFRKVYQAFNELDQNQSGSVCRKALREMLCNTDDESCLPPLPLQSDSSTVDDRSMIHWFELMAWIDQVEMTPLFKLRKTESKAAFDLSKKKARVRIRQSQKREMAMLTWHSYTHFSTSDRVRGRTAANTLLAIIVTLCDKLKCDFEDPDFGPMLSSRGTGVCEALKDFLNEAVPETATLVPKVFLNLADGDTEGRYSIYKTSNNIRDGYPPMDMVVWNRPEPAKRTFEATYEHGLWLLDGPPSAPLQGNLGNGWFVDALLALKHNPDPLLRNIVLGHARSENVGVYICQFYRDSEWHFIIVDARIPLWIGSYSPVFARNDDLNEHWASVIEKAYAKLCGQYESLAAVGGRNTLRQALVELTGMGATCMAMPSSSIDFQQLAANHSAMLLCIRHDVECQRTTTLFDSIVPLETGFVVCQVATIAKECMVRLSRRCGLATDPALEEAHGRELSKVFASYTCNLATEDTIVMRFRQFVRAFTHIYYLKEKSENEGERDDFVRGLDDQWYKHMELGDVAALQQRRDAKLMHRLRVAESMREMRRYHSRESQKSLVPTPQQHPKKSKVKRKTKQRVTTTTSSGGRVKCLSLALSHSATIDRLNELHDAVKERRASSARDYARFPSVLWRGGRPIRVYGQGASDSTFCLLTVYTSSTDEIGLLFHVVDPSSGLETYRVVGQDRLVRLSSVAIALSKDRATYKQTQKDQGALRSWLRAPQDANHVSKLVDFISRFLRLQISKDPQLGKQQSAQLHLVIPREKASREDKLFSAGGGDECLPEPPQLGPIEQPETINDTTGSTSPPSPEGPDGARDEDDDRVLAISGQGVMKPPASAINKPGRPIFGKLHRGRVLVGFGRTHTAAVGN